ncbi:MAG: single-stranded-DNA-specific exonuclease RecJ [Alsobacter sp.]
MADGPEGTRAAALLGVESSWTNRRWVPRLAPDADALAMALSQRHGLDDVLARVLAGRGVGLEAAEGFLDPRLRTLMPDPAVLQDMDRAVALLADAIQAGVTIGIFGDYDVDGAASSALLAEFLDAAGTPWRLHIPDRMTEGYGPNEPAMAAFVDQGCKVIVTVDCGTTSHGPIAAAKARGAPTVVLDHHLAPERLPDAAALVNPNRLDDVSGLGYLCAAGVVFMAIVAVNREFRRRGFWGRERPEPDLMAFLDLVALGTVADVVPLLGLNRAFVRQGLAVMASRARTGLRALADVARLDGPPRPYHLGFLLGPRINAGGRIGDASLGARLLLARDEVEAGRMAVELDRLNGERQAIERAMVEDGEAQALLRLGLDEQGAEVVVVSSPDWHQGVVGLVASRLKERFHRPAFAFAIGEGGLATGSARSIPGVDIGSSIRRAVDQGLALKGGGHPMAGGLTVETARLAELSAFLEGDVGASVRAARLDRSHRVDAVITALAARPELHGLLEKAGPYGAGHAEPLLAVPAHRLVDLREVGQGHLKLRLKSDDGAALDAMAFRAVGSALGQGLQERRGERVHVLGTLMLDRWQGMDRISLRVVDAAPAGR